jgi:hypothetical protein
VEYGCHRHGYTLPYVLSIGDRHGQVRLCTRFCVTKKRFEARLHMFQRILKSLGFDPRALQYAFEKKYRVNYTVCADIGIGSTGLTILYAPT